MKPYSWRFWVFGGLVLFLACMVFLIWIFGWGWTGFNGGYSKIVIHGASQDQELPQVKTLWDWLQLLVVPVMLAVGAGYFTWWSARIERQIAQQRYEQEQKIAAQRYQQDQNLALDKQREDLLQSYLDRMAELLLEKGLRDSQPGAEVRKVARIRTVSTLIQLDGKRASTIFVFLVEAQLVGESDPIIPFKGADLSRVKWYQGNLDGFNLGGANLSGATLIKASLMKTNLRVANLVEANLMKANLREADLSGAFLMNSNLSRAEFYEANLGGSTLIEAYLMGAELIGASLFRASLSNSDLSEANLNWANLSEANLNWADLCKADLSNANLSGADLSNVRNLEDAILINTNFHNVKGLTPEQIALCKTKGAIVDEETAPSVSPSQNAVVASPQEIAPRISPSPSRVALSIHIQDATSDTTSSREKEAASPTSTSQYQADHLLPSQEASPLAPSQATPPALSQD